MTTISAKIIEDSISPIGHRITTLELVYPRFIHAEVMTHRVFSRNARSNRAVPFEKAVQDVLDDPVVPLYWGAEKKGMQASEEVPDMFKCFELWNVAKNTALMSARALYELGLHKQICNRVLEPFQHITTLVTATSFENFFKLRIHPDAEPHIKMLAETMKKEMAASMPRYIEYGWHTPYIQWHDVESGITLKEQLLISAARCARVSYNNQGKEYPLEQEILFANKLFNNGHLSPFEHVAMCREDSLQYANFTGWQSFRNMKGQ